MNRVILTMVGISLFTNFEVFVRRICSPAKPGSMPGTPLVAGSVDMASTLAPMMYRTTVPEMV